MQLHDQVQRLGQIGYKSESTTTGESILWEKQSIHPVYQEALLHLFPMWLYRRLYRLHNRNEKCLSISYTEMPDR